MAKRAAKTVIKKKKWVPIQAPKLFNEQIIGESLVGEAQELIGRIATVSLMTLTGDPQKQTVSVSFRITGVVNDKVTTEMVGYKLLPATAKKLMRRNRSKIDDSMVVETADKKFVRIKPIIITRGRITGSVFAAMRKLERAYLAKMISKTNFEAIVIDVVQKKVQHGLVQMLRRLHPIALCEIRQLEFITPEKMKDLRLKITLPSETFDIPERKPQKKESATPKPVPKEAPQEAPKPVPKEAPQEAPKEVAQEAPKEEAVAPQESPEDKQSEASEEQA